MSQTPKSNPFLILGLPIGFDLDASTIERAYLSNLRSAHPDAGGVHAGGAIDADGAVPDAAMLNKARTILLDHEQRAGALLDVLEGPNASDCKDLPAGFLMEMMTRRQEIEEHLLGDDPGARARWASWARDERASYADAAHALFEDVGDHSEPNHEHLKKIRILLNAWRYIERLIEQLDPEYDPARADFR